MHLEFFAFPLYFPWVSALLCWEDALQFQFSTDFFWTVRQDLFAVCSFSSALHLCRNVSSECISEPFNTLDTYTLQSYRWDHRVTFTFFSFLKVGSMSLNLLSSSVLDNSKFQIGTAALMEWFPSLSDPNSIFYPIRMKCSNCLFDSLCMGKLSTR